MTLPKVSVGLPVHNGEPYLRGALSSLLDQEFEDFELVIADNASTDMTQEMCLQFARGDSRIRYLRNDQNIGAARNHDLVFERSRGDLFMWAAHDDEYPRAMLRRYVEAFAAAVPSVALVYSHCEIIDEEGHSRGIRSDHVARADRWPHRRLGHLLRWISIFNSTYGLIKASVLRKTRLNGPFPFSDYVLMAELSILGEFHEIPEPLLRLRFHAGRSAAAHRDPQALREWYDPVAARSRSWLSLRRRADWEVIRSAYHVPVRWSDKILCMAAAASVPWWRQACSSAGRIRHDICRRKLGNRVDGGAISPGRMNASPSAKNCDGR